MLLCDDLLLLLTDDASGKTMTGTSELRLLLAGALLTDLTLAGCVRLTEKGESGVRKNRVVLDPDVAPTSDPLLADACERLAGKKSWSLTSAVNKLSRGAIDRVVYDRLVRAEHLTNNRETVLGFIPVTRHHQVDGGYERTVNDALDRVLIGGEDPDDRTAALLGLLHAGGKLIAVVDRGRGIDRSATRKRATALMKSNWAAKAAADLITANRAAAVAAASAG
jgi:hypothetical protein